MMHGGNWKLSFILVAIMPTELHFIYWPRSLPSAMGFISIIRYFYNSEGPYCDLVAPCNVVHGCQQFGETKCLHVQCRQLRWSSG